MSRKQRKNRKEEAIMGSLKDMEARAERNINKGEAEVRTFMQKHGILVILGVLVGIGLGVTLFFLF